MGKPKRASWSDLSIHTAEGSGGELLIEKSYGRPSRTFTAVQQGGGALDGLLTALLARIYMTVGPVHE